MMQRRDLFAVLACGSGALLAPGAEASGAKATHVAWVSEVLKRMETIRPGLTRKTLLTVFTTEGGLSTPLERAFVSRDCPYFKVRVRFRAVGRPAQDDNGRVSMVEGDEDVIVDISQPYLEFTIAD